MASITAYKSGYRVQVSVGGTRDSSIFRTEREAKSWGARRETELRTNAKNPPQSPHTLRDALRRYAENESLTKRGKRWELLRLHAFESHKLPLDKPVGSVGTDDLAAWRDDRLKSVKGSTLLREATLLGCVFEAARREWKWIDTNPIRDMRKPADSPHRTAIITPSQIRLMLRQFKYGPPVRSVTQAVGCCFLVGLRTGMRAGELCGLRWDQVHDGYCILPMTKNGKSRQVPLTPKAMKVINRMRGFDSVLVFGIKVQTLDALFRKERVRAGLEGFRFHDARRTAATRIAKQVDVLMLCRIFGWSDPKMAMVYYSPTAAEMLRQLT